RWPEKRKCGRDRARRGHQFRACRADLRHTARVARAGGRTPAGLKGVMKLTIPTWLTLLRILMIPVLVLVFYLPYKWTNLGATAVFALASVTDWLDGWIARRYHQYSAFGAFLDPVADKLMVAVALFLIVQGHPTAWMALWAAVIVGREIAVSALREWMAELGQRARVKVAAIGKIKTVAQMVALLCLLYSVSPDRLPRHDLFLRDLVFHVGDW